MTESLSQEAGSASSQARTGGSSKPYFMKGFFEGLAKSRALQVVLLLGIIGVAIAIGSWASHRTERAQAGLGLLYEARLERDKELAALAATMPKPAAPAAKPGANAPADATRLEEARHLKTDAATAFPKTIAAYEQVVEKNPRTFAAAQALLGIGDLYFNHGNAERASEFYRRARDQAPSRLYESLAGYSLMSSQIELSKWDEALDSGEKALRAGENSLKGELLLSIARIQEEKKDFASATKTYDRIGKELPATEQARTAERRKALLPAN